MIGPIPSNHFLPLLGFSTLTAHPHIAGSTGDRDLANLIYDQWKSYNFDKVEMVNYSVLVSYPNSSAPNALKLMQGSEVIYTAHTEQEPPLTPGEVIAMLYHHMWLTLLMGESV